MYLVCVIFKNQTLKLPSFIEVSSNDFSIPYLFYYSTKNAVARQNQKVCFEKSSLTKMTCFKHTAAGFYTRVFPLH